MDFDFSRYVEGRRRKVWGGEGAARYAYAADVAMLQTFKRLRPVELAAASVVRTYKDVLKNQYLGTSTRVGPRQVPHIYGLVQECAEALGVPVPAVYVVNNPYINAYTFGTDEDAFIVLHSALIDHFEDEELKFVIGHETGHIQNKHVVYATVLHLMTNTMGIFIKWLLPPAQVALHAWYRRAEITCDRAGLLCCKDSNAAIRGFLKLASGAQKLYGELDPDAFLEQLEEGREGVGRFTEAFSSHPYVPKRIQALKVFEQSAMYRQAVGLGDDGLAMEDVDRRTSEIIQITHGKKAEEPSS